MGLSEILATANALVRGKEAEALRMFGKFGEPIHREMNAAKSEFGSVYSVSEMGRFLSPIARASYNIGKGDSTKFLFDAYATLVFERVPDAEAFIALLSDIRERVKAKLQRIDEYVLADCTLDWEQQAWERADRNKSQDAKPDATGLAPEPESEPVGTTGAGTLTKPVDNPPEPSPIDYPRLLGRVLEELKGTGGRVEDALNKWLTTYGKGLSRTSVTDYKAKNTKGKVSAKKCIEIENAIRRSAEALGVNSD